MPNSVVTQLGADKMNPCTYCLCKLTNPGFSRCLNAPSSIWEGLPGAVAGNLPLAVAQGLRRSGLPAALLPGLLSRNRELPLGGSGWHSWELLLPAHPGKFCAWIPSGTCVPPVGASGHRTDVWSRCQRASSLWSDMTKCTLNLSAEPVLREFGLFPGISELPGHSRGVL